MCLLRSLITCVPSSPQAGGWLGRVFLLDFGAASNGIDQFVSLGSPHLPPPPGVIDQTRGILTWVQQVRFFLSKVPNSFYVSIAVARYPHLGAAGVPFVLI